MSKFRAEKFTLPVVAALECRDGWQVAMDGSRDPVFSFAAPPNTRGYRSADAFEVRKRFFAIGSPEDALRFFREFGPFEVLPDKKTHSDIGANPVKWNAIQQRQEELKGVLLNESVPIRLYEFVFEQPLWAEIRFRSVTPETRSELNDAGVIHCGDVAHALRASIFLSRMRGFPWKRCARGDCTQLFEQRTRHAKIYCSESCAHLQAVNDYNARKARKHRKIRPRPA